ncbi:hypothetical protein GJ496_008316 [Pomphorhynchus laevis]|nr:hypothetical protein GJ496_008316 [Pomphorhynchus laevis]
MWSKEQRRMHRNRRHVSSSVEEGAYATTSANFASRQQTTYGSQQQTRSGTSSTLNRSSVRGDQQHSKYSNHQQEHHPQDHFI